MPKIVDEPPDHITVKVNRKLIETLRLLWQPSMTLARTVNRSLELLAKYDPRLLEAREYDLLNSLQISEEMKIMLTKLTGCKSWQAAVMEILNDYIQKKVTVVNGRD